MKTKPNGKLMGGVSLSKPKWLALMALLLTTTPINAFRVYTRIVQKVQNTDTKDYDTKVVSDMVPYIHAWYDENGKSSTVLLRGFKDDKNNEDKVVPQQETITLKDGSTQTWYYYDYGDMKSATTDQYYKVIVAAYNLDNTGKAKDCVWQSADLDVYNSGKKANEDIYLEIEYMPAKTTTKSRFSFHEETPWQAKGYDLKYYVCDKTGKHLATFQNVLNQMVYLPETTTTETDGNKKTTYDTTKPKIMSHPDNTSLWNAVVNAKTLTATTQFYISGGYYDNDTYVEKYQYRPFDNYAFNSNNKFKKANGYSDYGNCKIIDGVTTARDNAFFTVGESTNSGNSNAADVSYTLYLNTSLLSNAYSETNQRYSQYPKNQKVSVWKTIDYGNQSVTIQRNAALTKDNTGYDLLVNMVNLRPEDGYENQEKNTDHWDVAGSTRHMDELDFSKDQNAQYKQILEKYPDFYNADDKDIIYHYRVPKPQADFESLFMAFLPRSLQSSWTGSDDDWNKIIRPQVQEGKTAKGLIGGVFVPEHQAMEALTPNLPNSNYAQFDVFLNISKSMYLLTPVNSYDLTGPAVRYYNTSSHQFEETLGADHWGNGNAQYQYTSMAYNKAEKCWQYTGKFFQSINRKEDGGYFTDNGFRIRVNQLYTINYHEEPYWFSSQNANETKENIVCHQNQTYKEYVDAQTDHNKTIITTRPLADVPEWTTDIDGKTVHNPYGPDSYYYNHVVTCESGTPTWDKAHDTTAKHGVNDGITDGNIGKTEDQQRININFDLPTGFYTIKFYPQGDVTGKPYYTLEEAKDPGTEIPVPVNDYKYIRTYSANKAYALPKDMDVFTVTKASEQSATLHKINDLGYLPANTGLIIAYKTDISTGNTSDLEFSSDLSEQQFKDISKHYPRLNLTEYKGSTDKQAEFTKDNLLMPTTQPDGNTITSVPTTVRNDDGTVKARNYGFYLKKTYTDKDHTTLSSCELRFQRVREWSTADGITEDETKKRNTPTAERAYLQLPAETYGGTKYGAVSHDGFTEKAETGKEEETGKAKFYSLLINFDDETTAINDIPTRETKVQDNHFYTLSGIRVNHPTQKGIYIVNGKKVVVR